ncbi:MAG TPA: hypothetical protein VE756_04765 [Burkholderiales bacterium]|jgi:hypothetical protein|nr:hypothetical protein [Burkholderiales bacterium]
MKRIVVLLATLALSAAAAAQSTQFQVGSQPALEVQRLAPQLVAFAGGEVNFTNLVNGLAFGVPVTLTSATTPGGTQVVTFTPAGAMSVTQIAQLLESARQSLIARGIATPTAQQLGAVLAGGTLSTALGTTPVTGAVTTTAGLATSTQPSVSPAVAQQNAISSAVAGSTARRNMSDSVFPRGISDTLPTPAPTPAPSIPTTAPAAPAAGSAGGTPIPAASVPSTATPPALTPLRR